MVLSAGRDDRAKREMKDHSAWQPPSAPRSGRRGFVFPVARYVVLWIILSLVIVATICDLRTREVPDWIALAILTCAVLATTFGWGEIRWPGLFAGLLLGLACSAAVFYLGGLGGADVKLVAAPGAALGPISLLCVLFWTAIAGGLLALVAKSGGKETSLTCPRLRPGFSFRLCGRRDFAMFCSAKISTTNLPSPFGRGAGGEGNGILPRNTLTLSQRERGRRGRSRRGQALVEFAVVSLVLYMLLAAILTFGQILYSAQGIQQAVDTAARELSRSPLPANDTFSQALADSGVQSRIFDERYLVLSIDARLQSDDFQWWAHNRRFPAGNSTTAPIDDLRNRPDRRRRRAQRRIPANTLLS